MKLQRIKSSKDIKLDGITAEANYVDSTLRSVVLQDANGQTVHFDVRNFNDLEVTVPAPPKMVKRFKLSGTVLGLPVNELFESKLEALNRQGGFESRDEDAKLSIAETEVPETSVEVADEIPF